MDLLSIYNGMHGAVDVKKQTMFPSVPGQRCVRRESTSDVVVHDDRYSKHLGCLCTVEHPFAGSSSSVQVVSLHLASLSLCLVDGLGYEQEPVSPPHERLGVDVLVILREVQPTTQTLVHGSAIVLRGESQLGFDRSAE